MASLRYIMSVLCCFGVLFAEDLTCIYRDQERVVLSDNTSWNLPEESEESFAIGEVISVKTNEDGSVTYLIGQNQMVEAEFEETIPFQEKQIQQVYPISWQIQVEDEATVDTGGGVFSIVHMKDGDVMFFLSHRSLFALTTGCLGCSLPEGDESDQFEVGSSLKLFQPEDTQICNIIHNVTGEVFAGIRLGATSECTRRVFSHTEGSLVCFEDGSKIDFLPQTENLFVERLKEQDVVIESLDCKVLPFSLKIVSSDKEDKCVIEVSGDQGFKFSVKIDPEESDVENFDSERFLLTLKGTQEFADFLGCGVFEKGDVLNVYSFTIDAERFDEMFEDDPGFAEVIKSVNASLFYLFEKVDQE